jgi:preprotein translocase SecE subunit
MAYKQDQGRLARLVAFWALGVLIFYGCYAFYGEVLLKYFKSSLGAPLIADMKKVPIIGLELNGAMMITIALLATFLWLLYRWEQKPKVADLLIETESEMRKVTWPSMPEAVNSSIVVIVCVAFLMAYLAGADWFLGRLATQVLIGSG